MSKTALKKAKSKKATTTPLKKRGRPPVKTNESTSLMIGEVKMGIPLSRGLSEYEEDTIRDILAQLIPMRNNVEFRMRYRNGVKKILENDYPEYKTKSSTNKERGTFSVWRIA